MAPSPTTETIREGQTAFSPPTDLEAQENATQSLDALPESVAFNAAASEDENDGMVIEEHEPSPSQRTEDHRTGRLQSRTSAVDLLQSSASSSERSDDDISDEEDEEDDMDLIDQEEAGLYPETDADELFNSTPYVYQRRCFRGAKNVHTVKDVTFLGVRSDKICSGSDDGNWFVWDKATGRLDGIWKGDEQVVNVVEQHPSLPLVAVSGIDSTVKIFSPQSDARLPSWRRVDQAEQIIRDNTADVPDRMPGVFSRSAMMQIYLRALAAQENGEIEIEGPEGRMPAAECGVQ